ncbi:choice-of-anchor tandem repeat GloVer-containing protein [Frateuria sp. YIM B11624]|uniref:choice-of-anchor tandem repeat GloVer-containing protein n=1 Tax=Frateuria sp. YIM B11624 TaxID=3143185 RepID=UPI003C746223
MGIHSGSGGAARCLAVLFLAICGWGNARATDVSWRVVSAFPQGPFTTPSIYESKAAASNIVAKNDGRIYGLDVTGSTVGGAIYTISPQGSFAELYAFGLYDGAANGAPPRNFEGTMPTFGMLADGTIYGVTASGGPFDGSVNAEPAGTLFTYSAMDGFSTRHTFYGSNVDDGAYPLGVWPGPEAGSYYVLTAEGGPEDFGVPQGVLVKIDSNGTESIIHTFCTGGPPVAMTLASDGNFYGSLPASSAPDCGARLPAAVIFKLSPDGQLTVLHTGEGNDTYHANQIVEGADGALYGTTAVGGTYGSGLVFRLDKDGTYTVLHAFDPAKDGFDPGALVVGTDGNIYGSTTTGTDGLFGLVYRLTPSGTMTVVHRFTDGLAGPLRTLAQVPGPGPVTLAGVEGGGDDAGAPEQTISMTMRVRDDLFGRGGASAITFADGSFSAFKVGATSLERQAGGAIAAGYYPAAVADFNGDGHADILWTSAAKDLYVWFGQDGTFSSKFVSTYPAGWKVVGSGDVNGDGKDDLLWMNEQTHTFAYWLMNGASRSGYRTINVTSGYHPATFGDFNGDGKLDVAWTSARHDLYFWLASGAGFRSKYVATYPAGWQISGHGDVDGDGSDDLIWAKVDRSQWGYWLMSGSTVRSVRVATDSAGASYGIAGVADYDGNGMVDVLWSDGNEVRLGINGGCSLQGICDFSLFGTPSLLPATESVFNNSISP